MPGNKDPASSVELMLHKGITLRYLFLFLVIDRPTVCAGSHLHYGWIVTNRVFVRWRVATFLHAMELDSDGRFAPHGLC